MISVEEDRVACGEVTGVDLDDSTACEAIATADDADTKACTYTPAGAIARCAYVAGTYSDGGTGDNVMDTVVSADTCTSTLVAMVAWAKFFGPSGEGHRFGDWAASGIVVGWGV